MRNHEKPLETAGNLQKPSETFRNRQKPSETIRNRQKLSETTRSRQALQDRTAGWLGNDQFSMFCKFMGKPFHDASPATARMAFLIRW